MDLLLVGKMWGDIDSSWRRSGFTQPCPPPLANTQNGGTAIIFPLCTIWVPHDHSKDPKCSGCPGEKEDGNAEEGGEGQDDY